MKEQERRDALRARLQAPENKLPNALRRLGDALWADPQDPLSHEACREALPAFVQAQVMGEPGTDPGRRVKHHLDSCDACSAEYADLLDVALAQERGALPKLDRIPRPDLSFLPLQRNALERTVVDWARAMLARLAPDTLSELPAIAGTFFAQLRPRHAAEARAGYDITGGETLTARGALAVSDLTAQGLAAQVTPAQFREWVAGGIVRQEIETRAAVILERSGIEPGTAARFAGALAEHIASDPHAVGEIWK